MELQLTMDKKMEHIVIKFLNKMYGDLKEYKTDKYPNMIFYIKGKKVYMEQELKSRYLWVDYATIWQDLENIFNSEITENQRIITKWVEDTYKLRGITPIPHIIWHKRRWKTLFN